MIAHGILAGEDVIYKTILCYYSQAWHLAWTENPVLRKSLRRGQGSSKRADAKTADRLHKNIAGLQRRQTPSKGWQIPCNLSVCGRWRGGDTGYNGNWKPW